MVAFFDKRQDLKLKDYIRRRPRECVVESGVESYDLNGAEWAIGSVDSYEQAVQQLTNGDLNALALLGRPRGARNIGALIDRVSSFLFPLLFMLFNACYWGYYLNINNS